MSLTGSVKGSAVRGSINRLYELQGYSAYQVAVLNGFAGTEEEWLASLKGQKGDPGEVIHTDADGNVLDKVFVKKAPVYQATPDTLADVIRSAEVNATIQLAAGEYPRLDLVGVDAYPEGLTIVGGEGVTMAGISITSGILNSDIAFNSDVSNAIMPRGLTIKELELSDSFSLRNAGIEDLSIIKCHITSGVINIIPNRFVDGYGNDFGTNYGATRFKLQTVTAKNVVIRDCTIDDAAQDSSLSAIWIQAVDGLSIHRNKILQAGSNGIQVVNVYDRYVTGKIRISQNTISNTGKSPINLAGLRDATLCVVYNKLSNSGSATYISVGDTLNTKCGFTRDGTHGYNTYNGANIDVGSGIVVSGEVSYVTDVQAKEELEHILGNYPTYESLFAELDWWASSGNNAVRWATGHSGGWFYANGNGYDECWGTFTETVSIESGQMYIPLPFSTYDSFDVIVTLKDSGSNNARVISYGINVNEDYTADLVISLDADYNGGAEQITVAAYCISYITGV